LAGRTPYRTLSRSEPVDEIDPPYAGSRPSSVLSGSFSLGKFIAATAALATTGGVCLLIGMRIGDRQSTPAASTPTPAEPVDLATPDLPPPKVDVAAPADVTPSGEMRLDIPDPWSKSPDQAPSNVSGPDVERPDWD